MAYASRMLRGAEPDYDNYDREALAVMFSVKKYRHYVYGRHFKVVTDCEALVWFKTATASSRVQKWRFLLSEYDYEIIHRPGKTNGPADALSRNVPVLAITRGKDQLVKGNEDAATAQPERRLLPKRTKRIPKRYQDETPPGKLKGPNTTRQKGSRPLAPSTEENPSQDSIQSPEKKEKQGRPKGKENKKKGRLWETPSANLTDNETSTTPSPETKQAVQPNDEKPPTTEEDHVTEDKVTATKKKSRERPKGSKNKQRCKSTKRDQDETSSEEEETSSQRDSDADISSSDADASTQRSGKEQTTLAHTKEGLIHRKGNLIYFLNPEGQPLDKGATLMKNKKFFAFKDNLQGGDIVRDKVGRKRYWGICVNNNESIQRITQVLRETLTNLQIKLSKQKSGLVNFAVNDHIANVPWATISKIINDVFEGSHLKIVICLDTLTYVKEPELRDRIFSELHASPINGHKGVTKTYNRIKQKYF